MSLNWDVSTVKDWDKLKEDQHQIAVRDALIMLCMAIGMRGITEKNMYEFYARVAFEAHVWDDRPIKIGIADVKRFVGLRTNVSPVSTRSFVIQVAKHWMGKRVQFAKSEVGDGV